MQSSLMKSSHMIGTGIGRTCSTHFLWMGKTRTTLIKYQPVPIIIKCSSSSGDSKEKEEDPEPPRPRHVMKGCKGIELAAKDLVDGLELKTYPKLKIVIEESNYVPLKKLAAAIRRQHVIETGFYGDGAVEFFQEYWANTNDPYIGSLSLMREMKGLSIEDLKASKDTIFIVLTKYPIGARVKIEGNVAMVNEEGLMDEVTFVDVIYD